MSDSIQRTSVGDFPISQTVTVPASASLIFVSGTLPDLADPNVPGVYGNTEVQTVSVFNKIRKILRQDRLSDQCARQYALRNTSQHIIAPHVAIRRNDAPNAKERNPRE